MRLIIQFSGFSKDKREKHFGKVVSIMGNYEGDIYINLAGENEEMIEIELGTIKEKSKGSKKTVTSGVNLNAKAIRSLIIDGVEYAIRDIEYELSKLYKNCCVIKDSANANTSLYVWKNKKGESIYTALFYGYRELRYLKLASSTNILLTLKGCDELKTKFRNKEIGYTITEEMTDEERVAIWKKWLTESKDCAKN
jgi:hypothetical protein